MKRKNLGFFALCAASLLMFSCSEEEAANNQLNADAGEISFAFNIADITKAIEENNEGFCKDLPDLLQLAREHNLKANLTINGTEYTLPIMGLSTSNGEGENIEKLQTAVEVFPINQDCYTIEAATITGNVDGYPVVFYSGVANTENKYQNYVEDEFKMGNQKFCPTLHRKDILDLYVLCAEKKNPADFGFVKWNTHISKSLMLPIFVNYCNYAEGDHQPKVSLDVDYCIVQNGTMSFDELHRDLSFASESQDLRYGEIRFKDDADIPDEQEMHLFTLNLPDENIVLRSRPISTKELKEIEGSENASELYAWNSVMKAIHIDFCKCEYGFFQQAKLVDVLKADKKIWGLDKSNINPQTYNEFISKVAQLDMPIYYGDLAPNIDGEYIFYVTEDYNSNITENRPEKMKLIIEKAGGLDKNNNVCDKITIKYLDGGDTDQGYKNPDPESDGSFEMTGTIHGSCDNFTINVSCNIPKLKSNYFITLSGTKICDGYLSNIKFIDGKIQEDAPYKIDFATQHMTEQLPVR